MCIYAFNSRGQKILQNFRMSSICADERKWIKDYIDGEYETTFDLNVDVVPTYKLYKTYLSLYNNQGEAVNTKNYPRILLNASVAKGGVGSATLDIWALTIILQCYQAYCIENNFKYIKDGKVVANLRTQITDTDLQYISYMFCNLTQDFVIEAIKHMENGSAGFQKYYLQNMTKDENIKSVSSELINKCKFDKIQVQKMLTVIRFASHSGLLQGSRNFLSVHNKGRFPAKPENYELWKHFIQENSYFGTLVEPLFNIVNTIKTLRENSYEDSKEQMGDMMAELDELLNL